MLALPIILKFIPMLGGDIQRQIANSHTLFNISNVLIQAPFIPLLVKFVNKLVQGEDKDPNAHSLEYLDKRLLETPSIACGQVVKETVRMGKLSLKNLDDSMQSFFTNDEKLVADVLEKEKLINYLQREITDFMVSLANTNLSEDQSDLITSLFHVVSDAERIGDHAKNIVELTEYKLHDEAYKIEFSEKAFTDIKAMYALTKQAVESAISALESFDFKLAKEVIEIEGKIDAMEKQLRKEHIQRLNNRVCSAAGGALYVDLLTNLERVGDHSNNIAQMVLDQV
jgi:phosphate:Na+ symporter